MNITLRPVTDDDREFLLEVYEESRAFELSMTQWDAAQKRAFAAHQFDAQTDHYREVYPNGTHDIIVCDDDVVGRLYVDRGNSQIAILDITILTRYRRNGIGTELIEELKDEAGQTNRSVRIYLEHFNPAQKLFRELGFEPVPHEGIDQRFEWRSAMQKN